MSTIDAQLHALLLRVGALAVCLAGCSSELAETPGPPEIAAQRVELSDLSATPGPCLDLENGQSLLGVSAEGHAWVQVPDASGNRLVVVDPWTTTATAVSELTASSYAFESIEAFTSRSGSDAMLLADGTGWSIEQGLRTSVAVPEQSTSMCGSLRDGGMLLASGSVYERRDKTWWGWTSNSEAQTAPSRVIGFGSECLGTADAMWASGSDGTLWRIGALSASTPVRFEALTHAAATRDAIAVVDAEQLWINRSAAPGEPLGREEAWSRWQFDTGSPTDLSASGGAFWMLVAGETVVYRDGGFSRVDLGMKSGTPTRITAHDTGAWVVSNEALCHVSTGPMVRVQGAHPFSRSRLTDLPITIELPEQATEFDATLNGEPLTLSEDPEAKGRWSTTLNLTPRSWNDLRLRTDSTERQIPLRHEQLDWARHIQPIQQAFCSGCHGADSSAALDTEDAWVSAKEAICNQVVLNDQMPKDPTAAWTENRPAYKATIHQWLKGQNAACEIQP